MEERLETDFCLEIDFQKGSYENPSRVFKAMSGLIDSVQFLDLNLAQAIDISIRPQIILQEIEVGSLKSWLRNIIVGADDEALKKLDIKAIIGNYLVSAKYRILKRLRDKDSLQVQNIKEIQEELQKLAEETKIRKIPTYAIVKRRTLTEFWIRNSESTSVLGEADVAKYISSPGEVVLYKGQPVSDEMRDQLLTKEIKESETVLILKVKKPDYLGQSRWLFHHDGHPIEASIEDKNWLSAFQNRQVIVRPGDSLKARLRSEIRTGYDNEDILVHHYVTHVLEVIPGEGSSQTFLFPENDSEK